MVIIFLQPSSAMEALKIGGEKKKMNWKEIYMATLEMLNRMIESSEFSSKNDEMRLMLSAIEPLRNIDFREIKFGEIEDNKDIVKVIEIARERYTGYKGMKIVFDGIVEEAKKFLTENKTKKLGE